MTITVNTESSEGFRHSIQVDDHQLFTDLPKSAGGEGTAPEPHDYFDAALGACKALTLKLYAQKKNIPLTGSPWRSSTTTAKSRKASTPCM